MPTEYATDGPEQEVTLKRSGAGARRINDQSNGNTPKHSVPAMSISAQESAVARHALVRVLARAIAQDLGIVSAEKFGRIPFRQRKIPQRK